MQSVSLVWFMFFSRWSGFSLWFSLYLPQHQDTGSCFISNLCSRARSTVVAHTSHSIVSSGSESSLRRCRYPQISSISALSQGVDYFIILVQTQWGFSIWRLSSCSLFFGFRTPVRYTLYILDGSWLSFQTFFFPNLHLSVPYSVFREISLSLSF